MAKTIISEGKTTAEAIENGLKELKTTKNNVDIKILEEKKKSFFNILDPHIVKVEMTLKEEILENRDENKVREKPSKEALEKAKTSVDQFLKTFLPQISENIKYTIKIDNDEFVNVEISGENASKLIGYRGEALNSLQLILSNIACKELQCPIKVILDIENYREKRKNTLEALALKIGKTVQKTGKKVTLEPMTPYERKIIHTKLQDSEYVKTYSIGEDSNRRVVISKK